jgi:pimeloyl-ACP methyl ester carboxylesterase
MAATTGPTPGLLHVTMQPHDDLKPEEFHDWYNNEHGPTRLRLPFVSNGFRYHALDPNEAGTGMGEWLAIYDITDMDELTKDTYTRLRTPEVKSPRETGVMKKITVVRGLYDLYQTRQSEKFRKMEDIEAEGQRNIVVSIPYKLKSGDENVKEFDKWCREEHIDMISKIPGWLRTRHYKVSKIDSGDPTQGVIVHEYAPENGLEGPEAQAAIGTTWAKKISSEVVLEVKRRLYSLYYTFGPAPRELGISTDFLAPDGITRTIPAHQNNGIPALESYVTTQDGVRIPYRLEGSTDPHAPLIVLSNCILAEWGIWDDFVSKFFSSPENKRYRILRYHQRGRYSEVGSYPVTLDLFATDIIALLDALRVQKTAAAIGVSLGGATVLNLAVKHKSRVQAFISCDTNAVNPSGNRKTWSERITISEKEGAVSTQSKETIVGDELAEMTVRRWFVNENGKQEDKLLHVKDMVYQNSLEGFKASVQALFDYDLREEMKTAGVKGAFLVGAGDGVLPKTMKEMAETYGPQGNGAEYIVIESAGHLPMVEQPEAFTDAVSRFLS